MWYRVVVQNEQGCKGSLPTCPGFSARARSKEARLRHGRRIIPTRGCDEHRLANATLVAQPPKQFRLLMMPFFSSTLEPPEPLIFSLSSLLLLTLSLPTALPQTSFDSHLLVAHLKPVTLELTEDSRVVNSGTSISAPRKLFHKNEFRVYTNIIHESSFNHLDKCKLTS